MKDVYNILFALTTASAGSLTLERFEGRSVHFPHTRFSTFYYKPRAPFFKGSGLDLVIIGCA